MADREQDNQPPGHAQGAQRLRFPVLSQGCLSPDMANACLARLKASSETILSDGPWRHANPEEGGMTLVIMFDTPGQDAACSCRSAWAPRDEWPATGGRGIAADGMDTGRRQTDSPVADPVVPLPHAEDRQPADRIRRQPCLP